MSEEELSRKIKRGEVDFEFTYDKLITPDIVTMTLYGYERAPVFKCTFPLQDWSKLVKLVSRFDNKLKESKIDDDALSNIEYEEFLKSQELVPI